jgi:pyruvate,water dikinase
MPRYWLPLDSPAASLAIAGGKGANLARLTRAGFCVPPGFILSVAAYEAFLQCSGLAGPIEAQLQWLADPSLDKLEHASATIRAAFACAPLPSDLANEVRLAYRQIGGGPVAVRSSATAEDLPGFSFAGQQDTFLNVVGETALLEAVVQCWSSLWTARAIQYRIRNRLPHTEISLAVVVQRMVASDVSGVLFTADPLTGLRNLTVIDACFGLGEALVSGQVEPDHYEVDTENGQILRRALGSKAIRITGRAEGGVTAQPASGAQPALDDAQVLALTGLGQQVQAEYGAPQDIEWAIHSGQIYLLQSRPITTLFPLVKGMPVSPLQALMSFGAFQGMLDPITPLGQDVLKIIICGFIQVAGMQRTIQNQTVLREAGARLWVNITPMVRNSAGRGFLRYALPLIEPTTMQALQQVKDQPDLLVERRGIRLKTAATLARLAMPIAWNVLKNWLTPERRQAQITETGEDYLVTLRRQFECQGSPTEKLAQRLKAMQAATQLMPRLFPMYISAIATGMSMLVLLDRLHGRSKPGGPISAFHPDVLEITRGLPHNVTTEMDLFLWHTAQEIRADSESRGVFSSAPAEHLAQFWHDGALPHVAQAAVDRFMQVYGLRGLGEIDTGRERWAENATAVMQSLTSYLQITDEDRAPDVMFHKGQGEAAHALDRLVASLRRKPLGFVKARLARWAARRLRALLGLRESPKFYLVRLIGTARLGLLESGAELTQAELLSRADDIFFLRFDELEAISAGQPGDWQARVTARRAEHESERLRRQIPRLFLSNGRAFYEGLHSAEPVEGRLQGSPVSPGMVTGRVRVVRNPHNTGLQPGEILVCPGTDPSWTPLFLSAGGLVMEVGGMMTHGAVVAREYGIPAVVGVHQATSELRDGERIRVDGSTGIIERLDTAAD